MTVSHYRLEENAVKKARIVLALDSPMLRELLGNLIQREDGMEVVADVADPMDLLFGVDLSEVDAVIHAWPESHEMPGICTHLLAEYPDLLVLGIPPDAQSVYACRQEITTTTLPGNKLDEVIAQICQLATVGS